MNKIDSHEFVTAPKRKPNNHNPYREDEDEEE
jgi:hypothetical protein